MSSNNNDVRVDIDERRIGKAAGKATGQEISGDLRDLKNEMQKTTRAIKQVQNDISDLEDRIEEVERTKARAQREAMEDLRETLKEQVEEKRREYQKRVGKVRDDYRESIERLKTRFLNSIAGRGENFDTVESEFEELQDARSAVANRTESLAAPNTRTYDERTEAVLSSRNEFLSTIDEFLADREETAETIDSLQTQIPGLDGAATVTVPFWVVGVEKNGTEELKVLPVQQRGTSAESPTRADPYREYLSAHPLHGHTDMTDAVHEYVSRDEVRDALAADDSGEFADPEFLRRHSGVADRFVDALEEFELGGTPSGSVTRERPEATAEVAGDD